MIRSRSLLVAIFALSAGNALAAAAPILCPTIYQTNWKVRTPLGVSTAAGPQIRAVSGKSGALATQFNGKTTILTCAILNPPNPKLSVKSTVLSANGNTVACTKDARIAWASAPGGWRGDDTIAGFSLSGNTCTYSSDSESLYRVKMTVNGQWTFGKKAAGARSATGFVSIP